MRTDQFRLEPDEHVSVLVDAVHKLMQAFRGSDARFPGTVIYQDPLGQVHEHSFVIGSIERDSLTLRRNPVFGQRLTGTGGCQAVLAAGASVAGVAFGTLAPSTVRKCET